jgi:hypothetical protein
LWTRYYLFTHEQHTAKHTIDPSVVRVLQHQKLNVHQGTSRYINVSDAGLYLLHSLPPFSTVSGHRWSCSRLTSSVPRTHLRGVRTASLESITALFYLSPTKHTIQNSKDMQLIPPLPTCDQKGAHYTGIKSFNRLHGSLKQLSLDPKQFQIALKGFLYSHSFYSLDEYFRYMMD